MEQLVSVPASVYNKSLNTQSVTKEELRKYQPLQKSTYQIDLLQKELIKRLFAKADSLVDKTLSCPRIKVSICQTLNLNGVETGVLLSDFAQRRVVKTQFSRQLLYLTLLGYL